jgi:hypothetical protein
MQNRLTHRILFLAGAVSLLSSCNNLPSRSHGPIVLGDSSTIVTETDPMKLQDLVSDLQPVITRSIEEIEKKAPEQAKPTAPDTIKRDNTATAKAAASPEPQSATPVAGLNADFKEVSVTIPNLNAKISGNPDLHDKSGAVYTLVNGPLNGNTLRISGNITKVSQRYQSLVMLKSNIATLPLESLSITTPWEPLTGSRGQYRISGLDQQSLEYPDADARDIRNAVQKAAQRRRFSRKKVQELVNSVHHLRSPKQKPLTLTLRSVMWKIDGKDAQGRSFSKQIRVDVPL